MKDFKEYYKVTENNQPSGLVRNFFLRKYNEKLSGNIAIDLGCGAGNDTEFLISKGFRVANFLGKEDDWNGSKTTIEKEELLNYFKDFEINYFSEEKYHKDTARGKNKFWHMYTIMAQKV